MYKNIYITLYIFYSSTYYLLMFFSIILILYLFDIQVRIHYIYTHCILFYKTLKTKDVLFGN